MPSTIQKTQSAEVGKIYPNQEELADIILEKMEEKLIGLIVMEMQSGKTGVYFRAAEKIVVAGGEALVVTAHSSKEWKDQTQERAPPQLRDCILHRPDLERDKFVEKIKGKKNLVIFVDEVQIACAENQTLCKAFHDAHLFDIEHLAKNNIKIIQFSATPNGTFYDISNNVDNIGFIKVCKPDVGYTGVEQLLAQGRIKQAASFSEEDNECFEHLHEELSKYPSPKYHFVRLHRGENFERLVSRFCAEFPDVNYVLYTQEGLTSKQLDELLKYEPDLHTFIFIKERARCAKTFPCKKYIGVMYERCSKITCDDVAVQGLLGRACTYNDPGHSVIYTNLESVHKFLKLKETDFEDPDIQWKSNSTYRDIEGLNDSKGTLNGLFADNNYEGVQKIDFVEFKSFEDAYEWHKEKYPGSRRFNKTKKRNGYYNGGSAFKYKIVNRNDIILDKVLLKNQVCQLIRCYTDTKNPDTLIYLICYKN